jgi:tellurite resistance protein TehA-like permease
VTILGAPVCAVIAIGFGMAELARIKRGDISSDQRHIVWIGIGLGIANLLFTVIFVLYGLIASIIA